MANEFKNNLSQCVSSFIKLFQSNNAIELIKEYSLKGEINNHLIRPIAWRLFLNVHQSLSLADWITKTIESRKEYEKKVNKYISLTEKTSESTIKAYFEDNSIRKIIKLDIDRTYQEIELFRDNHTKQIFNNILFIWSKENTIISYKQGMNEMLAVFYYALIPFYFSNSHSVLTEELLPYCANTDSIIEHSEQLYLFFHDENALEPDLYALFDNLMKNGGNNLFDPSLQPESQVSSILKCLSKDNEEEGEKETKLIHRCVYVMNVKIRQIDNELYYHLKKLDINGLLFLQRWIKCIFNREFPLDKVIILWDAVLAYQDKTERYSLMFIDYIAIAMLVKIRKNLINGDQNTCLDNLLSYPDSDAKGILKLADKIKTLFAITQDQHDYDKNYIRDQLKKLKDNNLLEKQKENQSYLESQYKIIEGKSEENKRKKFSLSDLMNRMTNDKKLSQFKSNEVPTSKSLLNNIIEEKSNVNASKMIIHKENEQE